MLFCQPSSKDQREISHKANMNPKVAVLPSVFEGPERNIVQREHEIENRIKQENCISLQFHLIQQQHMMHSTTRFHKKINDFKTCITYIGKKTRKEEIETKDKISIPGATRHLL